MRKHQLLINQRFIIDEDLHTLKDIKTATTTRLELRLLLLICHLAKNPRAVVSRAQLINDIWDNYGGAEEGLNQAISALRKLMGDTDKKLIETVPKKGYILNAEVSENLRSKRPVLRYALFTIALIAFIWVITKTTLNQEHKVLNTEPEGTAIDTTYQKKELDSLRRADSLKKVSKQ
ncbi:transcriptional regulator [Pedobacter sp. UC225_65]|uniref:winged helix-turn-helix domain-containing protein n=1 Tax=Pedobacter sp. UC225_65 TaxID=3350173 RepID=UPI003672723A